MPKWLFLIAIIVTGFIFFIYSETNSNATVPKIEPVSSVNVSHVKVKDTLEEIKTIGTVQPFTTIHVKSLVDGQLKSVGFKEGDLVQANQVLFTIDPQPFNVQLQQAEAALSRDETQLSNAIHILSRAQTLKNDHLFAEQEFEQLVTNVDVLKATIESDKASIASAKLQLSYSSISSPVTGYAGNLLFNVGNIITAKDNNPLVIINQVMPIYVSFSVPEKDLPMIKHNIETGLTQVNVSFDGGDDNKTITGTISFVNNAVDTATGTIQLKATFPNTDKKLWPGQYVNISFPLRKLHQALIIPSAAIQTGPNGFYVFVVNNKNKVDVRNITPGPVVDNETVIMKGLHPEEIVVTEGQLNLVQGSKVQYDSAANNIAPEKVIHPLNLQVTK